MRLVLSWLNVQRFYKVGGFCNVLPFYFVRAGENFLEVDFRAYFDLVQANLIHKVRQEFRETLFFPIFKTTQMDRRTKQAQNALRRSPNLPRKNPNRATFSHELQFWRNQSDFTALFTTLFIDLYYKII